MRIGVLGGGQLGRMLALSGYQLGLQFRFFDPSSGAPVGQIGELVAAGYDDERALTRFLDGTDIVTYEFESIPLDALRFVARHARVFPPVKALEAAQDRLFEKELFRELEIPVPAFSAVDCVDDLRSAATRLGFPLVLKTRRLGYDGKGQVVIRDAASLPAAWERLGGTPLLAEEFVSFQRELSIIGVRNQAGNEAFYPLVENVHREGILRTAIAPSPNAGAELTDRAREFCRRIMRRLDYVGVMALELFHAGGWLLANEMAPRVHNSGHWTIEGAETSQFENHLRAILGLPLGSTAVSGYAGLINLVGSIPAREQVLSVAGAHLHLYGKTPMDRRKIGHVTVVARQPDEMEQRFHTLKRVLQVE